jgi:hypothetical protein
VAFPHDSGEVAAPRQSALTRGQEGGEVVLVAAREGMGVVGKGATAMRAAHH